MLPLCQMHPRAVPPPIHLDPLETGEPAQSRAAFPNHGAHGAHSAHGTPGSPEVNPRVLRDGDAPHQWSFPIRTSVAPSRVGASSDFRCTPRPEHRLRRKTPNGTIDAGYDGSPTQPFPGAPPPKQMILSVSAGANPYSYSPALAFHSSQQAFAADKVHSSRGLRDTYWSTLSPSPSFYDGDPSARFPPQSSPLSNSGHYQSNPPSTLYQPPFRPNDHNVRAFCPPPVQMNDPFGHLSWQSVASPWINAGYRHPNDAQEDHGGHPRYAADARELALHPFGRPPGTHPSFASAPLNTLATNPATRNGSMRQVSGIVSQLRFKERALSQAHKSYVDLLAAVRGRKITDLVKVGSAQREHQGSWKLLTYPKPPQPTLTIPRPFQNIVPAALDGVNALIWATHDTKSSWPPIPRFGQPNDDIAHGYLETGPYVARIRNSAGPIISGQVFQADHSAPSFQEINGHSSSQVKGSPDANARSSLEILDHLCEQCSWTWTEGMLLGGCLYYALGLYEDALKWFSRIVALDSSHVEAIANMAATLYCLNRQAEAEKHWLRAVKLRPSHLEAAEHLVGLLYKRRSEEAVEVITYIQQALRLPAASFEAQRVPAYPGTSHGDRALRSESEPADNGQTSQGLTGFQVLAHDARGYGSSGYALPGSENGRILALVHAKGTMLYGLKDISRASEAFEEAVIISVGRRVSGVRDLVRHIQAVLSPREESVALRNDRPHVPQPLLLAPERARHTARLVFSDDGGTLPGLVYVPDGGPKRAAAQTTSNSLLSLAKILQDAMSSGSPDLGLLPRPTGVGGILSLYYLSLSLQESPSTANNVGILLAGVQQGVLSPPLASANSQARPSIPGIMPGSGLDLALAYYHYGLRLDPKHVHLHTNLGSLLKDIGQLDLAIQMYERAVSCDGTFDIALTNLANAVKDRGRISEAIAYYRRAVSSNPGFAEAVCGLFTALNSVCDWRGRGGVLLDAGKYDRWHVDDQGMLLDSRVQSRGTGLTQRVADIVDQQLEEAAHWGRNTLRGRELETLLGQLRPVYDGQPEELDGALRSWAGQPWEGSRVVRLVERATRACLRQWYRDLYVSGERVSTKPYLRPRLPSTLAVPPAPTVLPFHTFTTPLTARHIRAISQRNAIRISCSTLRSPWLPAALYRPPPPPSPQLNVGYVSSDFNNHPLAHLMQSVFGFHDTSRVKAFCYATAASDRSAHRQKIEREAPVFRDVSTWPPEKLVAQIVNDEIHILVNLNGYTRGARNEVFAARPAPIQMSFMGFAGTLGAEWCDYLLADATAIPPQTLRPWRDNVSIEDIFRDRAEEGKHDWMYSENIIFCRDTFFCCDHAQSGNSGERRMTWEEEESQRWEMRRELFPSMADDCVILGNFNQLYKIEPTTFRCWLRVLAGVPNAVLWLLRFPELGENNLRKTAEAWAGAEVASRILFTDVAAKNLHIARARVCDLFLDTPECNAHTTAADVLWSSTPLLTLPRYPYKMCSRMAASILKGALPRTREGERVANELIAKSETEYEQAAIRLAGDLSYHMTETEHGRGRGRLAEMRKLLWENKWSCGLFNTRRWVRDVEAAYQEAWRRWVTGEGGDIYL